MKFVKNLKNLWVVAVFAASGICLWTGCSESTEKPLFPQDEIAAAMEVKLSGWTVESVDESARVIRVKP